MDWGQFLNGFNLDQQYPVQKQIVSKSIGVSNTVDIDMDRLLPVNFYAMLLQPVGKHAFVNGFHESRPDILMYCHTNIKG